MGSSSSPWNWSMASILDGDDRTFSQRLRGLAEDGAESFYDEGRARVSEPEYDDIHDTISCKRSDFTKVEIESQDHPTLFESLGEKCQRLRYALASRHEDAWRRSLERGATRQHATRHPCRRGTAVRARHRA